jgi:hypothetical protein
LIISYVDVDVMVIMVNSVLIRQTPRIAIFPFHSARWRVGTCCGRFCDFPIFYNSNAAPTKRGLSGKVK